MEFSTLHLSCNQHDNEKGFLLVTAVLILLVLSLMALAMSNTTVTEMMIAGNEKHAREEFFKADAGVNVVLAENEVPSNTFLPGVLYNPPNPPFSCNAPLHLPFAQFDVDGTAGNDVSLYLLEKSGTPTEIKVASCASEGNTTSEIIAGIQYGTPPGAQEGIGDPLEYNPL